jgi:hypothetical protein
MKIDKPPDKIVYSYTNKKTFEKCCPLVNFINIFDDILLPKSHKAKL